MSDTTAYQPITERINISGDTFYILKGDELSFIDHTVRKYKDCKSNKITDTLINRIICNMDLSVLSEETETKYRRKNGNLHFTIKLSKDAAEKLYSICYKGLYIGSILEEYAKKPYYEREKIFFHNVYQTVDNAVERKQLLRIVYRETNPFLIAPYIIMLDEWSSYNYLIGAQVNKDCPNKIIKFRSLRLSYISKCEQTNIKSDLCLANMEFDERIHACGVQFVQDKPTEIRIKLTPGKKGGKDMFDHMVFMRPRISKLPDEKEPDIYTFYCTETQAEFYFFKFGARAEVISPPELRAKFKIKYEKAAELYKDD